MKYINRIRNTTADGIGVRYSIYFSGCIHRCVGCHNVASWDVHYGVPFTHEKQTELIDEIKSDPLLYGITLSGGDPLYDPTLLCQFLLYMEQRLGYHINTWLYTGYTYEDILSDSQLKACLEYVDIVVDGKFILAQRSTLIAFRGSFNQKIIQVSTGQDVSMHFDSSLF